MTMADFFEFVRHSTLLAGNLTIAKAVHVYRPYLRSQRCHFTAYCVEY